jgi:hypothetical protein
MLGIECADYPGYRSKPGCSGVARCYAQTKLTAQRSLSYFAKGAVTDLVSRPG